MTARLHALRCARCPFEPMELVVATHNLANPGGAQSYALTIAEHLARLGHTVTLYSREIGALADVARESGLPVARTAHELPEIADGVIIGIDRPLALELAQRYPRAVRVFVVHCTDELCLPPPLPGVVAATVTLNDVHFARASSCVGAGEVVRLRQPVDLRRFSSRGAPAARPRRVLLLGNYHSRIDGRGELLREAWSDAHLSWREAGGEHATFDVAKAIAQADVVVGYGRSALEGMACGRPVFVHDHSGTEGWVTAESYPRLEAGGFAVTGSRIAPELDRLRAELEGYRPELGLEGQDLTRANHDARDHVSELVGLISRLAPGRPPDDPSAMRALTVLAEAQLRAEWSAERYRVESKEWAALLRDERERWLAATEATQTQLREAEAQLQALKQTRRFRLAATLAKPLDIIRRSSEARNAPCEQPAILRSPNPRPGAQIGKGSGLKNRRW